MAKATLVLAILVAATAAPQLSNAQTTYKVLHIFSGSDGSQPRGTLLRDGHGNLYGTTYMGGAFAAGTVFKLDPTGNLTILYNFTGGADGGFPDIGLIRDASGSLYGTTEGGGSAGVGTVFKLDSAGNETVLYSFAGGLDGAYPDGELLRDAAGNFYGATITGGKSNCQGQGCGTVFKLDPSGKKTVLHNFTGWPYDGAGPSGNMVRDAAGILYGTTPGGGRGNQGIAYRIDPNGVETILHVFYYDGTGKRVDGTHPYGGMITDASGNFYGATSQGGVFNRGTVFKIDTAGNETLLYSFAGYPTDTGFPLGSFVRDAAGNLYGAGNAGGTIGYGTVFKLDTAHNETVLHNFAGGTDGALPFGALIRDAVSGNLYGSTQYGGTSGISGDGAIFELTSP